MNNKTKETESKGTGTIILLLLLTVVAIGANLFFSTSLDIKENKEANRSSINITKTRIIEEKDVSYTYSEDRQSLIVYILNADTAKQVAVMEKMAKSGYQLQAADTSYAEEGDRRHDVRTRDVSLYFQKENK